MSRKLEIYNVSCIAVVADTHIGDRLPQIPENLIRCLRAMQVELILHAGDILEPQVLDVLAGIAPTHAVQGNVDFLRRKNWRLPLARELQIQQLTIGLTHGHGGWWQYLLEKLIWATKGARGLPYSFYLKRLPRVFSHTQDVIVFGHTHMPFCKKIGNTLFFNPGSVGPAHGFISQPQIGLLRVNGKEINAEWLNLADF